MLLYSNISISDSNCHHTKRVDKLFFQKHEKSEVYFTPTEKRIYEAYIARATTKEIRESFCITENTLKFHNKNIYSKLGVSSRKELMEIYKTIKS